PNRTTSRRAATKHYDIFSDHEQEPDSGQDQEQEQGQDSDDDCDKTHISINLQGIQDETGTERPSQSQPSISISTLPVRNLLPQCLAGNPRDTTSPMTPPHMRMIQQEYKRTADLLEQIEKQYTTFNATPS
ncbi:hypothetical protein BGW41_006812, partial [Actinomortierella wolfii]